MSLSRFEPRFIRIPAECLTTRSDWLTEGAVFFLFFFLLVVVVLPLLKSLIF